MTFTWGNGPAHNLFIPGVYGPTSPGAPGSESVVFSSPGTYQVICEVHTAEGMFATIVVQ